MMLRVVGSLSGPLPKLADCRGIASFELLDNSFQLSELLQMIHERGLVAQ
jgi:hypothetical protein